VQEKINQIAMNQ